MSKTSINIDLLNENDSESVIHQGNVEIKTLDEFFSKIFDFNQNLILDEQTFNDFIFNNYEQIISISQEFNLFLDNFDKTKEKLSSTHKTILSFSNNLKKEKEESDKNSDSSFEVDNEVDAYLEKRTKKQSKKLSDEDLGLQGQGNQKAMEDQIIELLDNFDISVYEKNYKDCLKYHSLFNEMKTSQNFQVIIQKYEIRKFLETNYSLMTDMLVNDLIGEKTEYNEKEIIFYLFEINQSEKAKIGYLDKMSKNISNTLKKELGNEGMLITYDVEFFQKTTTNFLDTIIQAFKNFSEYYFEYYKTEINYSQFCAWIIEECENYYDEIKQTIFSMSSISEITEIIKEIVLIFNNYESNGITLSFHIQRLFAEEFDKKIESILTFFSEKLSSLKDQEEGKLYTLFAISNIDYFESELQKSILKDCEISQEFTNSVSKGEMMIKDITIEEGLEYQNLFVNSKLKCSRFMILFWNLSFYLLENILKTISTDVCIIFASCSIAIIEQKIYVFIDDFILNYANLMRNNGALNENQSFNLLSNFYTIFYLLNCFMKFLEMKLTKYKIKISKKWNDLYQKNYNNVEYACNTYFKQKLLLNLPKYINDEANIYISSNDQNVNIIKPSSLFIKLGATIESIMSNFDIILIRNLKDFFTNRLLIYVLYIFEYHFYFDYHNNGKSQDFKFMVDKAMIQNLDLKLNENSIYLMRKSYKLGSITKNGMNQFIFDIHFLCLLINYYIKEKKYMISPEEFLARILHVYCNKEIKGISVSDFSIKKELFQEKIQKYLSKDYFIDKTSFKKLDSKEEMKSIENSNFTNNVIFFN